MDWELQKLHVLIIDDDEDILNLVKKLLENEHCILSTALSPAEARTKLKSQTFNLIISDLDMPGESGIDLLADLKESAPNTLRIIISAYSDRNNVMEAATKAQVGKFITKPIDNKLFIQTVREFLQKARNQRVRGTLNDVADQLFDYDKGKAN